MPSKPIKARRFTNALMLSRVAGLTTTYVGQVERGDRVPSLAVVLKLARGLGVPPADLLVDFNPVVLTKLPYDQGR
jgi:transcriptional regulator with XRE-family HTH domain